MFRCKHCIKLVNLRPTYVVKSYALCVTPFKTNHIIVIFNPIKDIAADNFILFSTIFNCHWNPLVQVTLSTLTSQFWQFRRLFATFALTKKSLIVLVAVFEPTHLKMKINVSCIELFVNYCVKLRPYAYSIICIAHIAKAYNLRFILALLTVPKEPITPELSELKSIKITFNGKPIPLLNFVNTCELTENAKGYFPFFILQWISNQI